MFHQFTEAALRDVESGFHGILEMFREHAPHLVDDAKKAASALLPLAEAVAAPAIAGVEAGLNAQAPAFARPALQGIEEIAVKSAEDAISSALETSDPVVEVAAPVEATQAVV